MMSIHEGSLYEDQSVESFHKPNRPNGLYQTLKENSKLLYPDRLSTPLSTPEVTSLLSGVERSSSLSLITSQAPSSRFLRGEITTEQEMYARGFLEALDELHTGVNRQPEAMAPDNSKPVSPAGSRMNVNLPRSAHHHSSQQDLTTTSQFISGPNPSLEAVAPTYVTATMDYIPNIAPPSQTAYASAHSYAYSQPLINHFSPAMEYSGYSSPPIISTQSLSSTSETALPSHMMKELQRVVPADSKTQEHMKVERKKARNRIAASKCRIRRLQRESDLQGKVRILKDHNQELNNEVKGLKLQINNLKKALVQHMKGGCQVNLPEGYGLRSDSVSSE